MMENIRLSFFGQMAVEAGMITPAQLDECVHLQIELEQKGHPHVRLGDILVAKGYMSREQVEKILELQKKKAETGPSSITMTLALPAGSTLFSQGNADNFDLYLLLEVKVAILRDGVKIATYQEKGAFLGETSTLLKLPRDVTALAETDATVMKIPEANVDHFFRTKPAMALKLARLLAQRYRSLLEYRLSSPWSSSPPESRKRSIDLFGMASLEQGEDGKLVLKDIRTPGHIFVGGEVVEQEREIHNKDLLQIGRLMLQVFTDHPGMLEIPESIERTASPPLEVAPVLTLGQDLPEAPPPPSGGKDQSDLASAFLHEIEALQAISPLSSLQEAFESLLAEGIRLEALERERSSFPPPSECPETLLRELERQRAEIDSFPNRSSLQESLHPLRERIHEASQKTTETPMGDLLLLRAWELGSHQKEVLLLLLDRWEVLLRECAAFARYEPLYRIFVHHGIPAEALFAWATAALTLEERLREEESRLREERRTVEELSTTTTSFFRRREKELQREEAKQAALIQQISIADRVATLQRLRRWCEKPMIELFWSVYEKVALLLAEPLDPIEMPWLRAFLRWGVLGCSPRFLPPETTLHLLRECSAERSSFTITWDSLPVFYADEIIEGIASGVLPPSPDEDLELNRRNTPEWKVDRTWRRLAQLRIRHTLLEELRSRLEQDVARLRETQTQLEKRVMLANPTDAASKKKAAELKQTFQSTKIEAGRKEEILLKIRETLLPHVEEERELAEKGLEECEAKIDTRQMIQREVRNLRRTARLTAHLKETFLPFTLRDCFRPQRQNINTREVVIRDLQRAERLDPLLFSEPLLPGMTKKNRVLFRNPPTVILTPCLGTLGYLIAPRFGFDGGRFALPLLLERAEKREEMLWHLLADFRYDTSKAAAGVDVMNSDTLVAAYAEIRWKMRKKDREVRQKAAIYTEETERTNWRRHYELYMRSAEESGKLLFYKCPELYERIIDKFIELPEGCERLHVR